MLSTGHIVIVFKFCVRCMVVTGMIYLTFQVHIHVARSMLQESQEVMHIQVYDTIKSMGVRSFTAWAHSMEGVSTWQSLTSIAYTAVTTARLALL